MILEDYKINIRIKLSALWTSVMFLYLYGDYFELYVPHKVEGLISGLNMLNSPIKLLIVTIILSVPAVMIFLSFVLRPGLAKWLNIGVGIFFTLFTFLVGLASLTEWRTFYVYLSFLESILTACIICIAWNWPKLQDN